MKHKPRRSGPSGPSKPQSERAGRRLDIRVEGESERAYIELLERYGTATAAVRASLIAHARESAEPRPSGTR